MLIKVCQSTKKEIVKEHNKKQHIKEIYYSIKEIKTQSERNIISKY